MTKINPFIISSRFDFYSSRSQANDEAAPSLSRESEIERVYEQPIATAATALVVNTAKAVIKNAVASTRRIRCNRSRSAPLEEAYAHVGGHPGQARRQGNSAKSSAEPTPTRMSRKIACKRFERRVVPPQRIFARLRAGIRRSWAHRNRRHRGWRCRKPPVRHRRRSWIAIGAPESARRRVK